MALPLLAVSQPDDPSTLFILHLSLLVAYGVAMGDDLSGYVDDSWFTATGLSRTARRLAAGAAVTIVVTGVMALITLATSAALRYDVSTQYLQLLSELDIAWAAAATMVGARMMWGRTAGLIGGIAVGIFCAWSIWRYVDIVGFADDGSWIVSGSDLMRYVIPFDMIAGAVALAMLVTASFRAQPIEQARV